MAVLKTLTKSVVAFVFILFVLADFAAAQPWTGDGTEDNPYQIWDANDLNALATDANYYDAHFLLMADINLSGITYTDAVIPYSSAVFTGVFDANAHVILNLTINTFGADTDYLGLFGCIEFDGVVKNLGIENANVTSGNTSEFVGVLAGVNNGTITECYATGQIIGGSASQSLGGLVGANAKYIYNCYADVDVAAGASSQKLGGLTGMQYGLTYYCYASGFVAGAGAVGGFAGEDYFISITEDCFFIHPDDGGGPDNGIANPLTDLQMRNQASFTNWDFFAEVTNGTDEIWKMSGYPVLNWQVPVAMPEFAMLAKFWQVMNCQPDQLCSTVDWYSDGNIDINDLVLLTNSWLHAEVTAYYPPFGDDFETGDFSKLPWIHGGSADWVIDSNVLNVYEGAYSARSGEISHSQGTSIEFTVDTTDYDIISFNYKVSSEADFDFLVFYIDGSPRASWSGKFDWGERSYNFSAGVHTFKWLYYKDGSGSSGSDCAWIDNIRFLRLDE